MGSCTCHIQSNIIFHSSHKSPPPSAYIGSTRPSATPDTTDDRVRKYFRSHDGLPTNAWRVTICSSHTTTIYGPTKRHYYNDLVHIQRKNHYYHHLIMILPLNMYQVIVVMTFCRPVYGSGVWNDDTNVGNITYRSNGKEPKIFSNSFVSSVASYSSSFNYLIPFSF